MSQIIAEMELAQAAYKFQPIDNRFDLDFMFEEIYEKHQITSVIFNESLKFYSSFLLISITCWFLARGLDSAI